MKYFKLFNTNAEYEDYITVDIGDIDDVDEYHNNFVTPHIAYILETEKATLFKYILYDFEYVSTKFHDLQLINTDKNKLVTTFSFPNAIPGDYEYKQIYLDKNTHYKFVLAPYQTLPENAVINENGYSFYIDKNGDFTFMTLSDDYFYTIRKEIILYKEEYYEYDNVDSQKGAEYEGFYLGEDYTISNTISNNGVSYLNQLFKQHAIDNNYNYYLSFNNNSSAFIKNVSTDVKYTNNYFLNPTYMSDYAFNNKQEIIKNDIIYLNDLICKYKDLPDIINPVDTSLIYNYTESGMYDIEHKRYIIHTGIYVEE